MTLKQSVKEMKGIGPKKAEYLSHLDLLTLEDVLLNYPRTYEDRSSLKKIEDLIPGEPALIKGRVLLLTRGYMRSRRQKSLRLLVEDVIGNGQIEIIFFNSVFVEKLLEANQVYTFFGRVNDNNGRIQMIHPEFERSSEDDPDAGVQGILPVYSLTKGISQNELRRLARTALSLSNEYEEYLSPSTVEKRKLCQLDYALNNIHFPQSIQKYKEAKFRLIYDELFLLQTGLLLHSSKKCKSQQGISFNKAVDVSEFTQLLPYTLTEAQLRVTEEIIFDMESTVPMSRLVQGDVGSGKTVVAAIALYKAVKSGYQGVLMAPTELLAKQHYESFCHMFEPLNINVGFLAAALSKKEKLMVLDKLESGEIQVIIGTHALIQPDVMFNKLGLVITDEQHRFGVNQRLLLTQKGESPDVLVMTATPIPRTLAVVIYGDLDISVIDELPPGRKPIVTKITSDKTRKKTYQFVKTQIDQGRQAYIVAPLIEDSEQLEGVLSAESVYKQLKKEYSDYRIGLLHGGMKQAEKDQVMEGFAAGEIHILVATVVIEVGINVPNATIMVIENAERFGLAQLHQLRGRVGRGEHQSYCIISSNAKSEVGKERGKIMEETTDGFIIAERDLQLRGPGELLGTRQHGLPELKLADLIKHMKILNDVRADVIEILQADPELSFPENQLLKERVNRIFKIGEGFSI